MTGELRQAINDYFVRWARAAGSTMQVSSPLAAWLLIASLADAEGGEALGAELGLSAEQLREARTWMLADPHPALRAALAVWARRSLVRESWSSWSADLPPGVEVGDMPAQAAADAWALASTEGMIATFPLAITSETALMLASAMACDAAWTQPYETTAASSLGGEFGPRAARCLVGDDVSVVVTQQAGEVVVHQQRSNSGLVVTSVLGTVDLDAGTVVAAALEIVELGTSTHPGFRPPGSLPVGDATLWSMTLRQGLFDRSRVLLPAWRAEAQSADIGGAPGVAAAVRVASAMLSQPRGALVSQSAVAEYGRTGFKAASVTAFGLLGGIPEMHQVRELTARFNRPFAVVAATSGRAWGDEFPWNQLHVDPRWDGVPVFVAWVTDPIEPLED